MTLVFGLVCPENNVPGGDAQDGLGKPAQLATHQRAAYMKNYFLGAMPYTAGYPYDFYIYKLQMYMNRDVGPVLASAKKSEIF